MKATTSKLTSLVVLSVVLAISLFSAIPIAHADTLVCQADPAVSILGWDLTLNPFPLYASVALSPTSPLPSKVKIHLQAYYKSDTTLSCDISQFSKTYTDWIKDKDPTTYTVLETFQVPNKGPGTYLFVVTAFADGAFLGQTIVDPREGTGP